VSLFHSELSTEIYVLGTLYDTLNFSIVAQRFDGNLRNLGAKLAETHFFFIRYGFVNYFHMEIWDHRKSAFLITSKPKQKRL
jgi:hypothetical protein